MLRRYPLIIANHPNRQAQAKSGRKDFGESEHPIQPDKACTPKNPQSAKNKELHRRNRTARKYQKARQINHLPQADQRQLKNPHLQQKTTAKGNGRTNPKAEGNASPQGHTKPRKRQTRSQRAPCNQWEQDTEDLNRTEPSKATTPEEERGATSQEKQGRQQGTHNRHGRPVSM